MQNTYQLSPYLNFNGNCREAMEFYQSVLGGELEINTFGEMAPDMPEEMKKRTMHATLKNDVISFMASDGQPGVAVIFGDNVHMSLAGTDEAQLKKFFDGLSVGGKVNSALAKQVWGDVFGMLTDKFGIHWMVNIGSATQ